MSAQYPPPGWGEQPQGGQPGGQPGQPGQPQGYGAGQGGYPPPAGGVPGYNPGYSGYGPGPAAPPSSTPLVLSIIGIVCWFLCPIAAIVLGLVAQPKYSAQGQPSTLAKVAWIGGIVFLALDIVYFAVHGHATFSTNTTG